MEEDLVRFNFNASKEVHNTYFMWFKSCSHNMRIPGFRFHTSFELLFAKFPVMLDAISPKRLSFSPGVFLLCWLPFFTVNIMNAICIRLESYNHPACSIDPMLISLFVWLGYLNSFINPIIYTIFNIEFRKAFKRIFTDVCITYK